MPAVISGSLRLLLASCFLGQAAGGPANPYAQVKFMPAGSAGVSLQQAAASRQYMIASFPDQRQVAYVQLPDNVWRVLVLGAVTSPKAIAVDMTNRRLFVADPPENTIWWYSLFVMDNGLLATTGQQNIAVKGYHVNWMAVNGVGDLYFTGKKQVDPPASSYDAIYRQDSVNIATHSFMANRVKELFTRSNSGNPNPRVWMPSGVAVDSFSVYWGNMELGKTHGALCKGPRQNIGKVSDTTIRQMNTAAEEVRGVAATGTLLFYLTPSGVYGTTKMRTSPITDVNEGLVAEAPVVDTNSIAFDPRSITWDGDGTLYFTEATQGVVYSLPAENVVVHNLTKFADAPGVYGISMMNFDMMPNDSGASRAATLPWAVALLRRMLPVGLVVALLSLTA